MSSEYDKKEEETAEDACALAKEAALDVLMDTCGDFIDSIAEMMGLQTEPPISEQKDKYERTKPHELEKIDDIQRWVLVRAYKYKKEKDMTWTDALGKAKVDLINELENSDNERAKQLLELL